MKIALVLLICIACVVNSTPNIENKLGNCEAIRKSHKKDLEVKGCNVHNSINGESYVERIYGYPKCLENLVNTQIGVELDAFHIYMNMGHFFEREDRYFPGVSKFFHNQAMEELEHAQKLMRYQHKRGGRVNYTLTFPDQEMIDKHLTNNWTDILAALKHALALEKQVTNYILCLHKHAQKMNDVDLQNFLETHYVPEQFDSMKILSNHVKSLTRMSQDGSPHLAEYQFDMITFKGQKN